MRGALRDRGFKITEQQRRTALTFWHWTPDMTSLRDYAGLDSSTPRRLPSASTKTAGLMLTASRRLVVTPPPAAQPILRHVHPGAAGRPIAHLLARRARASNWNAQSKLARRDLARMGTSTASRRGGL